MKIASWNVNGIKARIDAAQTWLRAASPDIALLQETKCVDDAFPRLEFETMGYNIAVHGQKGFNGVALFSKLPFDEVNPGLAGDPEDVQARYLEAVVSVKSGVLRVVNIYLPNGNPPNTEKFTYKLAWMTRLRERIRALLTLEEPLVIAGDFNVIPTPEDVYAPAAERRPRRLRQEAKADRAWRPWGERERERPRRRSPALPTRASDLALPSAWMDWRRSSPRDRGR
jgi:exodeoxyribonuclease-3